MDAPKLLYGPYSSPRVTVGEFVACEIRGLQRVKTFTDAPIPQPIKSGQGAAIIVCGDLVRALQTESNVAVAHWWGVSTHQVSRWREALGIGRFTEGTMERYAEIGNPNIGSHARDGLVASLAPDARAKRDAAHSATMRGRLPEGPTHAYRLRTDALIAAILDSARTRGRQLAPERIEHRLAILTDYFRHRKTMVSIAISHGVTKASVQQMVDQATYRVAPILVQRVRNLRRKLHGKHVGDAKRRQPDEA